MAMESLPATAKVKDAGKGRASLINDPKIRGLFFQIVLIGLVVAVAYIGISNAVANLRAQNIASGFGFWDRPAGFAISQTLIDYSPASSYGRAFFVGLLNTLLVGAVGIVLATILGFVVGIARLSPNWLLSRIATAYVDVLRNIPLLLQLLFWYFAVLKSLPAPRQSLDLGLGISLNIRGLFLPRPVFGEGSGLFDIAVIVAIVAIVGLRTWARRRQDATGQQFPVLWTSLALIIGLPFLALAVTGFPVHFDVPRLQGFNFVGGITLIPELVALILGLVLFTAAFIAEIVRSGIVAVSKGQSEAAGALGLHPGQTLRLVVIPQAMRVIVPPLTSQYLNLVKNSSLAVAIGYPDLVAVFAGTVLNQTGQAVEVITITMLVYLTISLSTSAFMNWFNARIALVER
ncbi:general L-amino acid transport system permease protein [Pseudoxanthobacter soli DSM 19599]|uniref:General L-amino acid transport system permease protein n=1 Tax=Pseudoxanthobacter soli DSM 19599 TaxID=1123029 RepID=A0A1M7ZN22_9HYPH|nr:amino acid ABC transporter permease [Pseudoxanthobacter soli]SHO66271.1 general L-amino acid transport system permease protein [Pseudoxanthobacter soli DSM 19599]